MEQTERVPCPYCREMILVGAVKCKECGSNLGGKSFITRGMVWARNFPDRKLLGVASCIAHNMRISPTLVRLGFVLLTFVSFLGLFLYLALAALIPAMPGQRSAFETLVDAVGAAFDNIRGQSTPVHCAPGAGVQGCCEPSAATTAPPPPPLAPTTTNPTPDATTPQV